MPPPPARTAALLLLCLPALAGATDPLVNLPRLDYRGGRVLEQVRVVPVFWGPSVSSEAQAGLGPFYRAVVQSPVLDLLGEYSTTLDGGTGQRIGPGTATDPVTIAPANRALLLAEADVARELEAQVAAGALPAPDADTLYMVHFPPGVQLQQGSALDCSEPLAGQFCGYHAAVALDGGTLLFGAMPDLSQGLCASRCAVDLGPFDALTVIASHELFEAVTDPVPGASWYDPQHRDGVSPHAEVADICELPYGAEPRLVGPTGPTWVVQREWSNRHQGCLVSRDDVFPVSLAPAELAVAPGGTGVVTLEVGPPASALDQEVEVVVAGIPAGTDVQPRVTPSLLRAGQPARLELAVGPQATADTLWLELLFVGPRAVLFRTLTLVVAVDTRPLTLAPAAVTLGADGTAQLTVGGDGLPGLDGGAALALAAEGLPPGLQATFDPPTLAAGQPSTLTLTRLPGAPPARAAPFTVVARGPGIHRSGAGSVDAEGDDFTVALDAAPIALARGGSVRVPVRTTASGTPRRLTLSLVELPPSTVGTFEPPTVLAGESATLTLVAGAAAPLGSHLLEVQAQGPFTRQTAVGAVAVSEASHGCGAGGGAPWLAGPGLLALGWRRRRSGRSSPAPATAEASSAGG